MAFPTTPPRLDSCLRRKDEVAVGSDADQVSHSLDADAHGVAR